MKDYRRYYLVDRILLFLLLLAMAFIGIATYMAAFYQNPASQILNSPMPVDKTVYHAGDSIIAAIRYCRYTKVPFDTIISFSNELVFDLPARRVTGAPVGCGEIHGKLATVPDSLPPGHYRLVGRNEYRVIPWISWVVRTTYWTSEGFDVTGN